MANIENNQVDVRKSSYLLYMHGNWQKWDQRIKIESHKTLEQYLSRFFRKLKKKCLRGGSVWGEGVAVLLFFKYMHCN